MTNPRIRLFLVLGMAVAMLAAILWVGLILSASTVSADDGVPPDQGTTLDQGTPPDQGTTVDETTPTDQTATEGNSYTATITPNSATVDTSTAFTVTVENRSYSYRIGQVQVDFTGTGFTSITGVSVSASDGNSWTVTDSSGSPYITATANSWNNALQQNETVSLNFTATPTATGLKTVTTDAWQAAQGPPFDPDHTSDNYKSGYSDPQVTVTGPPSLSINNPSAVTEGNNVVFTVTLSTASGSNVTVNYATADNTAVAPGDYISKSGTLTFTAGQTSKTITVSTINDALDEDTETFYVNLSGASGATISDGQGVGTINDNDLPPNLYINDPSPVTEGNDVVFTVTLSAASGRTVTVDYYTDDDSAHAPGDYISTSGTLTFNPGDTVKQFTVTTVDDAIYEGTEQFRGKLNNANNAGISDSKGWGTILDNDPAPPTIAGVYSSDIGGNPKDSFLPSEDVYATITTTGGDPGGTVTVDIYVTAEQNWSDSNLGQTLTNVPGDSVNFNVTVPTGGGTFLIWTAPTTPGDYDIVVDVDQDGEWGCWENLDVVDAAGTYVPGCPHGYWIPEIGFTVTTPPTVTITFYQSGVGGDFTGTVATIDGTDYDGAALTTGVAITKNVGDSINFAYYSPLDEPPTGDTQYVWTSTTGGLTSAQSDATFTVTASGNVTGNYITQYQVTFDQSGLDSTATGELVVTVDGNTQNYENLPYTTAWIDAGDPLTYSYEGLVASSTPGKQFAFVSDDGPGSPFNVNAPTTITGYYVTQYYLTVVSSFGTPGGEGWYNENTNAQATVTPLSVPGVGGTYDFTSWAGDATGTSSPSDNIFMDSAKTATALWTFTPTILGAAGAPEYDLVIDWFGIIRRYPVTIGGILLEDVHITSPDGTATLTIPMGTLVLDEKGRPLYLHRDADITVTLAGTPTPPAGTTFAAVYELLPSGVIFENGEAGLIITYDPATVPPGSVLVMAYFDETLGQWVDMETAGYVVGGETIPNTVISHFAHFTYFALLVEAPAD
jgi:hypothetical protein